MARASRWTANISTVSTTHSGPGSRAPPPPTRSILPGNFLRLRGTQHAFVAGDAIPARSVREDGCDAAPAWAASTSSDAHPPSQWRRARTKSHEEGR